MWYWYVDKFVKLIIYLWAILANICTPYNPVGEIISWRNIFPFSTTALNQWQDILGRLKSIFTGFWCTHGKSIWFDCITVRGRELNDNWRHVCNIPEVLHFLFVTQKGYRTLNYAIHYRIQKIVWRQTCIGKN